MKSKVLRAFPYAFDGVTARQAHVGDEIDFLDMTDGLAAEGYVEKGVESPASVTTLDQTPAEKPPASTQSDPETPAETVEAKVRNPAPAGKPKRK